MSDPSVSHPHQGLASTRLVSYDIWDTVIRRRCHPDAVKLFVAREILLTLGPRTKPQLMDPWAFFRFRRVVEHQIGQEMQVKGGDCEYPLREVISRLIKYATKEPPKDLSSLTAKFLSLELAQEKRVVFIDPDILERISNDGASRRIFISDFYMPKSSIFELLSTVGASQYFDGGYVSCDVSLNKYSGRLFQHVLREESCSPQNMFHLGDNRLSDVESPAKLGINSELYLPAEAHGARKRNESRFTTRTLAAKAPEPVRSPETSAEPNAGMMSLALEAAPLLVGFALFILFRARQQRLPEIYFFTREGEFVLRLYRILREASPFRDELPAGRLLEVSRIATFAPSLKSLDANELMRLWRLYWVQTPRGFLSSLDLCTPENLERFARQGLQADQRVPHPWANDAFLAAIREKTFSHHATEHMADRREILLEYFQQQGITNKDGRYGVVDIGWRGTIQDNIALLHPESQFNGFYLGLNQMLNPQPPNAKKEAFGPQFEPDASPALRKMLNFVAPIEMLTNSNSGSVVSYERQNGKVVPIRSVEDRENRVFQSFTGTFQDSVAKIAVDWAQQLNYDAVGPGEMRGAALEAWRKIIQDPDLSMAKAYLSLSHNETFGHGGFVDKSQRIERLWPLYLLMSRSYRHDFGLKLGMIGWTEAYAKLNKSPLLLWVARRYFQK